MDAREVKVRKDGIRAAYAGGRRGLIRVWQEVSVSGTSRSCYLQNQSSLSNATDSS